MSYHDSYTGTYTVGKADIAYVSFCATALLRVRGLTIDHGLRPLASAAVSRDSKTVERLAEKRWLVIWHRLSFSFGMARMFSRFLDIIIN